MSIILTIWTFLRTKVPWQIWAVIALTALIWLGGRWHAGKVENALSEADRAGYARAMGEVEAAARALEAKANALAIKIREKNDADIRNIAAAADAVRLRGPGRAACPAFREPAPGAGGPGAPGGAADAAGTGLPDTDRIALPFGWTVDQAERCDANRAEALSWRDYYRQLADLFGKK